MAGRALACYDARHSTRARPAPLMLVIRQAQIDTMLGTKQPDFEAGMVRHLRKHFAEPLAAKSDGELGELVRRGIERARGHGADHPLAFCQFIDLMVALGEDFDTNPAYPWAAFVLAGRSQPTANARIAELAEVAVEYLRITGGEGGSA